MKAEPNSHKRFVLGGVLPFVLLLIALTVAPQFIPHSVRRAPAIAESGQPPVASSKDIEDKSEAQQENRRVALDVVERWESEYHRQGGRTRISADDLQHLRRALL